VQATQITEPVPPTEIGGLRRIAANLGRGIHDLSIAEKTYGIVAFLVIVTTVLVVMSIQSVRLQTAYRQLLATSATAAINIERVNGLIYAIVMESRGIYMSTDHVKVKQFGDELLKRDHELADVVSSWEQTIRSDDEVQFFGFKKRITQFIEFRKELVRLAVEISPAAGREWGDNDASRSLRSQLNVDLEALGRIYAERASEVVELGDMTRLASWYLALLGIAGVLLAALNVVVVRRFVITPLSQIAEATDQIAAGKIELSIPYVTRKDEIGRLALAVQNFRDAVSRNAELEQLEQGTAKQRDKAMGERDAFHEKYHAAKWQLAAAVNNMPQGMVMLNAAAEVLVVNDRYRKMYGLPLTIKSGSPLRDIMQHRTDSGLYSGNIAKYLAAIIARIAKRTPTNTELELTDGRIIRISEQPMDGGGWVATHDDFTEQRRAQRILERTERFLVTVIENISQAVFAKDARDLRYTFVNRAAEKLLGMQRSEIIGKTARELFPAETAELIEQLDRQLLAGNQEFEVTLQTVATPSNGRRTVAVRRLRITGGAGESHVFLSMIEDRTDEAH
jgi:PAS domain S-box-containing protein